MQPLSTQLLALEVMIGCKNIFVNKRRHRVIVGVYFALATTASRPVFRKEKLPAGARAVPLFSSCIYE